MPLQRSPLQRRQTLAEFYQELASSEHPGSRIVGQQMLELLNVLNALFPHMTLWGLTSLARLVLSPDPLMDSGWFVIVSSAVLPATYYIEYLLPASRRPWEHAYVRGESQSMEETKQYLLIAMRESEGWVGNPEMEAVLGQYGLAL